MLSMTTTRLSATVAGKTWTWTTDTEKAKALTEAEQYSYQLARRRKATAGRDLSPREMLMGIPHPDNRTSLDKTRDRIRLTPRMIQPQTVERDEYEEYDQHHGQPTPEAAREALYRQAREKYLARTKAEQAKPPHNPKHTAAAWELFELVAFDARFSQRVADAARFLIDQSQPGYDPEYFAEVYDETLAEVRETLAASLAESTRFAQASAVDIARIESIQAAAELDRVRGTLDDPA